MNIVIELGPKFQLKLTILILGPNIPKNVILRAFILVTYNKKLFRRGADTQEHFNVSSSSSRRDNNLNRGVFRAYCNLRNILHVKYFAKDFAKYFAK